MLGGREPAVGGTGSVAGVFAAVIFITSIDSALVFLRIPAYWNDFIAGAILLSVLLLDGRIRQIVDRRIRARRYAVHERGPRHIPAETTTARNRGGRPMKKKLIYRWETALLAMLVAELVIFGLVNPRFLECREPDLRHLGLRADRHRRPAADPRHHRRRHRRLLRRGDRPCRRRLRRRHLPRRAAAAFHRAGALVTGALCGLLNATVIHLSKIQPLVVTLGSLYLFQGTATVASGLVGAGGYEGIGNFPEAFNAFGYAEFLGLPAPLALFLALSLVLIVLLHFTRFGRTVFLSGQSERAARFAGIPVGRVQTITYVITGISAAIAGLVMSAYFGSARVDLGSATLLPAVTAAVLGGASIYGGQGSILGTPCLPPSSSVTCSRVCRRPASLARFPAHFREGCW